MDRHPFSIENILKDTRGAGSILKIAPTSEALALAERMAGKIPLLFSCNQDFMMELTSHQSDVGAVLEFGNQLISEGLVNEKEESEIREQMIALNDRWEALRMAAMDRQTKYVTI